MKFPAALALCLSLAAPALADDAWPEECRLSEVASFPMTLREDGHVVIPVAVEGREKTFVVDTGGYASSLSPRAADDLGLKRRPLTARKVRDLGGATATEYVRAGSFALGSMVARDFDLMVLDGLNNADGLIAPDLLLQFDVEFDFAARRVNLFKPHPCSGKAVYWKGPYVQVPFDTTEDGHVRVGVTLDGRDTMAMLDTGSPVTLITLRDAARYFDIDPNSTSLTPVAALHGGQGGTAATYAYPFKSLTMGGVNVNNPRVLLTDSEGLNRHEHTPMLIGMNVMRHLHLYFAYHEHELYISPGG